MTRLIFLFTSHGSAPGANIPWVPETPAKNKFVSNDGGLPTEGYFYLLRRMIETGIVDEVLIFIESNRGTGSCRFKRRKGFIPCFVVPDITYADQYLKPDDIIWARGGFRSWFSFLNSKKGKHWLILYAADTGREKWMFWDIIFNDLNEQHVLDRGGRYWFPFKKPIHEEIFKPLELELKYDVCIGASHIHDKKAQWKMIEIANEYKKLYGENLKCVLPGAMRRGARSSQIPEKIKNYNLDIEMTSMISRQQMNTIYNQSKLFVYLGYGGQNDRGALESLRCGTPVMLASYNRHAFFFKNNDRIIKIANRPDEFKSMAIEIRNYLQEIDTEKRKETSKFFQDNSGVETIILPEMKRLFDVLKNNEPNYKILSEEYVNY